MAGKRKNSCSLWLTGLFMKSTFGGESGRGREREMVESGPLVRKFLPFIEKLLLSTCSGPGTETTSPIRKIWNKLHGDRAPSLGALASGRSPTANPLPVPGGRMPPQRVGLWGCDWGMNDRLLNRMQLRELLADRTICWCPEYPPRLRKQQPGRQEEFQHLSSAWVSGFLEPAHFPLCFPRPAALPCCPPGSQNPSNAS